jgi:hypothetical protein
MWKHSGVTIDNENALSISNRRKDFECFQQKEMTSVPGNRDVVYDLNIT